MKILALIPLRGGSKSIKNKNIKTIAGKPLCEWVLMSALNSKLIEKVYVSTDSERIKNVVNNIDSRINIIDRPEEYSTDESSTESVMQHFQMNIDFDFLVTIQATSPLLESKHIDLALKHFFDNGYDSLLSVVRTKRFFWTKEGEAINYEPESRPRRQDYDGIFMENGAFYITSKDMLNKTGSRLSGSIGLYEMPAETGLEIDEPLDWHIVEKQLVNSSKVN
jgi:CMP-N-acetylneuraminic acid synthetase